MSLGAELLRLAGLAGTVVEGEALMRGTLESGKAAERFERMVAALGGPADFLARAPALLPRAGLMVEAAPERGGIVTDIDVRAIGLAVVELGGGRARAADAIDPSVGLTRLAALGEEVGPERPLAMVHARDALSAEAVIERLREAYCLGDAAPRHADPVVERILPQR